MSINEQLEKELATLKADADYMTEDQIFSTVKNLCDRYGTEVVAVKFLEMGLL